MYRSFIFICFWMLIMEGVVMAQNKMAVNNEIEFFGLIDLTKPGMVELEKAVKNKDWKAAKEAWGKYLEEILAERWVWSYKDREKIMKFLEGHDPKFKDAQKKAEKVFKREFSAQGITRTLNKDMQWESSDWGYEWGNVLNRHHYWKDLGMAWWQTRDEKYPKDWALMVRDWIKDNPVKMVRRGPWRSLETGIRVSVWLDAMSFFMDAPEFDASLRYEMTKSLVEHARYLYINNGRFKKGNWQTCECSGLAFLGIILSEFKESENWRKRAFDVMSKHMKDGVYPDGAQYELTPGYHYWVLREFLELIILAEKNGYKIPGLQERHEKMFEFLMHVSKPDGKYMPLGDAGSGRSIGEAMGRGALVYNRPDMRYLGIDKPASDWIWHFPIDKILNYKKLKSEEPKLRSHMLPYAKYGVMRTGWKKNDRWLLFDCAPWGGAHSHQDQLQVLLYSGRDLIIDSGQIPYDNPLSKSYFKSDKAHNVLLINGEGPPKGNKFNPRVLTWSVKDSVEFASGKVSHNGFTQQRSVVFVKPDYWVIIDNIRGKGSVELTRLFHLPIVDLKKDKQSVSTNFSEGDNIWIFSADESKLAIQEGLLPAGRNGKKAPVAAFISEKDLPVSLCTVLVPFKNEKEIPSVKLLKNSGTGISALEISFKDGRKDLIAVAQKVSDLSVGKYNGNGIALIAREKKGKEIVEIIESNPIEKKPK
jgi:hypothetical protein